MWAYICNLSTEGVAKAKKLLEFEASLGCALITK